MLTREFWTCLSVLCLLAAVLSLIVPGDNGAAGMHAVIAMLVCWVGLQTARR